MKHHGTLCSLALGTFFLASCGGEARPRNTGAGGEGGEGGVGGDGGSGGSGGTGGRGGAGGTGTGGKAGTGGGGSGGTGGGGTGGGGSGGESLPDAGASPDTGAGTPDAGAAAGIELAGKLHRYVRSLRCMRLNTDPRSCFPFKEDEIKTEEIPFGGDPAVTYDVVLRVRGIIEPRGYHMGALQDPMNPWLYVGGVPGGPGDNAAYNTYRIGVSDPKESYWLNRNNNGYLGSSRDHDLHKIDYPVKMKVKGGAKIEVANGDRAGSGMNNNHMKLKVEGVPEEVIMQGMNGFNGQFFYIEVMSVTPAP